MKSKTMEIVDLMNELMEIVTKETVSIRDVKNMGTSELKALQLSMNLFDKSMELAIEQAEVIDSMNGKLDRLLKLVEKKGV